MNKQFCPYCMSPVSPGESCPVCGLTEGNYTSAPHHLPPGTVLAGRYLMGRVLGEGGFGITYIGCDLRLELKVAIKEYFPTDRASRNCASSLDVISFTGQAGRGYESGKEKFLFEARTMARMDKQPQIVSVRDFFEYHNTAYIVMEYVEGTNLKDVVSQRGGRIPAQELLETVKPLFSAMQSMHDLGLIHRDISPDNLMLENGMIRLLDFGCARESADGAETMTIALKQGYAPIEQYQQKGQGPWTDVYALAATFYFCMTGKVPPRAVDRIFDDGLVLPQQLGADLTESQEQALLKALAVRPRSRFQSVQEFGAALYAQESPAVQPEPPRPKPEKAAVQPEPPKPKVQEIRSQLIYPETYEKLPVELPEPPIPPVPPVKEEKPRVEKHPSALKAEEKKPEPKAEKMPAPRWKKILFDGIGVAALLAVVMIIVVMGLKSGTQEVSKPGFAKKGSPAATAVQEEIHWDNAYAVTDSSEENFLALLKNGGIQTVALKSGNGLTLEKEPVEINKPVLIEEGAYVQLYQNMILGPGGYLEIRGSVCVEGFLQIKGGSIRLAPNGTLEGSGLILAQKEEDILDDGGSWGEGVHMKERIRYFDEEAVFQDAVHVSTWEELAETQNNYALKSVVIDGNITLEDNYNQVVPVMIAPGASVTTQDVGPWGFEQAKNWDVEDTWLINYGTMDGYWHIGGWNGVKNFEPVYVNYGHMEGTFFIQPNTNETDGSGIIINSGTLKSDCSLFHSVNVINTGTFEHVPEDDNMNFLNFLNSWMFNSGTIRIYSETNMHPWASFGGKYMTVLNAGTLEFGNGAYLENNGVIRNWGSISLAQPNAMLQNYGYIESDDTISAVPGANLENQGVIAYYPSSTLEVSNLTGSGALLPFTWGGWDSPGIQGAEFVRNEEELRSALENDQVATVYVDEEGISLTGDLVVEDKLLAIGGGSIEASGHDVIVRGEKGGIVISQMEFGGGELVVENRASVTVLGRMQNMTAIRVRGGGIVANAGWLEEEVHIELQDGGSYINLGGTHLPNGQLLVGNGCTFWNLSELNMDSGDIRVDQHGSFVNHQSDLRLEGDGTFENYGYFSFYTGHEQNNIVIGFDLINQQRGWMEFRGNGVEICAPSENYGVIQLDSTVRVQDVLYNVGSLIMVTDNASLDMGSTGRLWGNGSQQKVAHWTER